MPIPEPFYSDGTIDLYHSDCLALLKELPDECIDLIATDPPYAMISGEYGKDNAKGGFMGKTWDAELPSVEIWKECLRVLKPGAFLFCMSAPRADLLANMIIRIQTGGFSVRFSPVYHAFAQGFPKSLNISKAVDHRLGKTREVIGTKRAGLGSGKTHAHGGREDNKDAPTEVDVTLPASEEAKELEGLYSPSMKPAVEVIIIAQAPMTKRTFIDQALLWYEERNGILRSIAAKLKECYNIPNEIEWDNCDANRDLSEKT